MLELFVESMWPEAAEPFLSQNKQSELLAFHSKVLLSQLCLLRVNEKSRLIFNHRPNREDR